MAMSKLSRRMFVINMYTASSRITTQLEQYTMVSGLALASDRLLVQFLFLTSLPVGNQWHVL